MAVFWVVAPFSMTEVIWRRSSSPWWWRQQVPPKRRYISTRPNGATTQKTAISIFAAVRTSNPTSCKLSWHHICDPRFIQLRVYVFCTAMWDLTCKRKDIVVPVFKQHAMKRYGGVDIQLNALLTSTLHGGGWSASRFRGLVDTGGDLSTVAKRRIPTPA
jgi:hypothetical protein